jgi:peroxiredoxin
MTRHGVYPLLALAVLATSAVTASVGKSEAAPLSENPVVGKPAPAFTVSDTKGKTHSLESYRGKWVVLEWFNHDCPYTRKHYSTKNMQTLQREYTEKGVVWISVVSSAPGTQGYLASAADADRAMTDRKASPSFIVRDTAGTLGRLYGARTTPHLYVIDAQGVLRYAGAIDNKPSPSPSGVSGAHNYLKAALDAGLAGKPIAVGTTQPYGCDVKYSGK